MIHAMMEQINIKLDIELKQAMLDYMIAHGYGTNMSEFVRGCIRDVVLKGCE